MWPKRRTTFAAVKRCVCVCIFLSFSVPASAFFGLDCFTNPASILECFGVNPGVVRVDSGLEKLDLSGMIHSVHQQAELLRAQDFKSFANELLEKLKGLGGGSFTDSFSSSLFGLNKENLEKRKEIVESGKKNGSPTVYEQEGLRAGAADAVGTHSSLQYGYKTAAVLGEDAAVSSVTKYLSDAEQSKKRYEDTLKKLEEYKENVEPQSDDVLAMLDALGLGEDALAIVRQIFANLVAYDREKMITNILEAEVAYATSELAVLESEMARIYAARYADAVDVSMRDRSTDRPVTGAHARTRE